MDEIKVSVIVPVYNVEKYLEECLDSLIRQTLKEIEILLIDDGSTDLSGDICDRYAKEYENIRVIHKVNEGLGNARNDGAKEAIGTYIYFIDSDDYLDVGALEYLYKKAVKNQLDILLFSAESFSDEDDLKFNPEEYRRTKFLDEIYSGKDLFEKLYSAKEYYASIPLRLYRREFYEKGEYVFPNIIHEDEFPAFLSLIDAKRVMCIEYKFYKRRYRKGSIMTSEKAYKSVTGYVYTWKKLMEVYPKLISEKNKIYYNYAQVILKLIIELYLTTFNKVERKKIKKDIIEIKKIARKNFSSWDKSVKLFLLCPQAYVKYRNIQLLLSKNRINKKV